MHQKSWTLALLLLTLAVRAAEVNDLGARQGAPGAAAEGRLLVMFRTPAAHAAIKALGARTRLALSPARQINERVQLLDVGPANQSLDAMAEQLRRDPEVELVSLDRRRYAHSVPNDPLYAGQWYLQAANPAAVAAETAWNASTGSAGIVIAILDSGVRFEHPDLGRAAQGGKLLPGYDFVSGESAASFLTANDGDGWDADPSDPGDWINSSDTAKKQFSTCKVADSSWHGTRTAGMIGAATNNATGIAGLNWSAWILPVRVLGKCGGFDSDILTAMRWAAGLHVNGVPDNPYPARIINMSLGSNMPTPCSVYRSVVDEIAKLGVLIVASAGNEGGAVDEPADCPGVLGVAGLRHAGTKVGYSNLGPQIGISAPAGNCGGTSGACVYSLDTTSDKGLTAPSGFTYTDQINFNLGTSFSAPIASGVAGLMLAVNGRLDPATLVQRMGRGASVFPTPSVDSSGAPLPVCHAPAGAADVQNSECVCTTAVCGAGMLNAAGALQEALRPVASVRASGTIAAGANVRFDAGSSSAACGRSVAGYSWSAADAQGQPVALADSTQSTVSLPAPSSGVVTLTVIITDNTGATDSGIVHLTATSADSAGPAATATAACPKAITISAASTGTGGSPAASGAKGGGGGAIDYRLLLGAAAMLITMRIRGRRRRDGRLQSCR